MEKKNSKLVTLLSLEGLAVFLMKIITFSTLPFRSYFILIVWWFKPEQRKTSGILCALVSCGLSAFVAYVVKSVVSYIFSCLTIFIHYVPSSPSCLYSFKYLVLFVFPQISRLAALMFLVFFNVSAIWVFLIYVNLTSNSNFLSKIIKLLGEKYDVLAKCSIDLLYFNNVVI